MELTHAVILLATAPKSRIACWMVLQAVSDYHPRLEIPDEALDQHTRRGKQMGRGIEHFLSEGQVLIDPPDNVEEHLGDLESEARDHWEKVHSKQTDDLPHNPWLKKDETWLPPADKAAPVEAGSLFD